MKRECGEALGSRNFVVAAKRQGQSVCISGEPSHHGQWKWLNERVGEARVPRSPGTGLGPVFPQVRMLKSWETMRMGLVPVIQRPQRAALALPPCEDTGDALFRNQESGPHQPSNLPVT